MNDEGSSERALFGAYRIVADADQSVELQRAFPAEGFLRAFQFESANPIKYGSNIGQSLQTLRILNDSDAVLLNAALQRIRNGEQPLIDQPFGLWTKCDRIFADYFLENWRKRNQPMAFMLYDPPPAITLRAPIFIHSDKVLRLIGRFGGARYVAGHKSTAALPERTEAREWFWQTYRQGTVKAPTKDEFDVFWDAQNGVRAYLLIQDLIEVSNPPQFKLYGRALEWGYPMGVGYRYLSLSQASTLLHVCNVADNLISDLLAPLVGGPVA